MVRRKYIPAIVIMFVLFFMIAFVTGLQNPLGVIVKFQFGLSNGGSQLGNFVNFMAYALMGLPAGYFLRKYGYKMSSLIATGIGFTGVGILYISGLAANFWIYLLGAFVAGFAMCMLNAVVNPMLNSIGGGGNRGNQLIQIGGAFNSLAATVIPFVVGALMGQHASHTIKDADPVFFVHLSDFFPDIGFRIICNLEKLGMFSKVFNISGSCFFAVADTDLSIIGGILQAFIVIKLHMHAPQDYYITKIQHIQHKNQKNLTKKYRSYAV